MIQEHEVQLAKKDLGKLLCDYRKRAELTQSDLSSALAWSRQSISAAERGVSPLGQSFWPAVDAMLGAQGELLSAFERCQRLSEELKVQKESKRRRVQLSLTMPHRSAPEPGSRTSMSLATAPAFLDVQLGTTARIDNDDEQGDTGDMLRRSVLAVMAAAAGHTVGHLPDLPPDVDHWRETAWEYGHSYFTEPPGQLLASLGADLAALQRVVNRQAGTRDHQPLLAIMAQLTGLAAKTSARIGRSREATHLWRVARSRANESADRRAQLWVRGHEIVSGIYQGRPLSVLLDLANQASSIAASSNNSSVTAGQAEVQGGRAQVLALLGRPEEARTALEEQERVFERLPTHVTTDTSSIFGWPEGCMWHTKSFVHSVNGSLRHAFMAQDRALSLYSPEQRVARCQVEMHRAKSLVVKGDVAQGANHAQSQLGQLAPTERNMLVLTVAGYVLDAVPVGERSRPAVVQFHDLLISARREVGA
ncbi:helix-turn-helix transcriptional regulator [Micromonospora sonneratiae]|uniref:Helix-turn-helix transcriptional regulator n=1 Tax=Micromonospora sonneratiae TaxID=1184706 RepID=A0ABW3YLV6_9ACTN